MLMCFFASNLKRREKLFDHNENSSQKRGQIFVNLNEMRREQFLINKRNEFAQREHEMKNDKNANFK